MRGVLINKFTDAYPSILIHTINDRENCTEYNKKIKSTGPHTIFTYDMEEDIISWTINTENNIPCEKGMLLTKGNQLHLEDFGMKKKGTQWLRQGWIHIFMTMYYLLTMSSSNIIKKVISKANFDFNQNILHKANNHIIERGIQANHI